MMLKVVVKRKVGAIVEVDCNCDSSFMLRVMNEVRKAIRDAYYWIPINKPCYLIMDNAGGHGSVIPRSSRQLFS